MKRTWRETVMACFEVPLQYRSERTEKKLSVRRVGAAGKDRKREHERRVTICTNVLVGLTL